MYTKRFCGTLFFLAGLFSFALQTPAQTTAFTYQGRFTDSSMNPPAGGVYTMTFRLYDTDGTDAQNPGNLIATQNATLITVTNGTFTTRLDFGSNAFNTTQPRFLEIQVGSTILTPRQQINAAPFSIKANHATSADTLSSSCVGCVTDAQIAGVTGTKIVGNVANADNATNANNALKLGNVAADQFVLTGDTRLTNARPPTTGSGFYIQNGTSQQTNAAFNVDGRVTVGSLGIGTVSQTNGELLFAGGADRFLTVGRNPAANSNGNALIITGGASSLGSINKDGGELRLAGGKGTGTGGSGNIVIKTAGAGAVSGTTDNTYADRVIYVAKAKPLALVSNTYTFTRLFSTQLTGTNIAAGRVYYAIRAVNGTNAIAETGMIKFIIIGGAISCSSSDKISLGPTINSQCNLETFANSPQAVFGIGDVIPASFGTPTVHEVYFRIENDSGSALTLEP